MDPSPCDGDGCLVTVVRIQQDPVRQDLHALPDPLEGGGVGSVVVGVEAHLHHLTRRVAVDEVARTSLGRDPTLVHDDETVAELLGLVHVVGRDDEGDALPLESEEAVPQDVPGLRVQTGRGLVEEQQLGVVDEAAGDDQPALHAAGEVLDLVGPALAQLGEVEQLSGPLPHLCAAQSEEPPVDPQVLLDGELLVEQVLLRAVADACPDLLPVDGRVETEDAQLAARHRRDARDHPHRRGLPRPVGSEEPERFTLAHLDVDGVDSGEVAELLRQVTRGEEQVIGHGRQG